MCNFDENLIEIKKFEVLSELPNPFLFENGTMLEKKEQWEVRRRELYKLAVEMQYGTQPPAPEFMKIQTLCCNEEMKMDSYRIIAGRDNNSLSFKMVVFKPKGNDKYPAVVDGDLCWRYIYAPQFIDSFTDRGIMLVMFDRTEIAPDLVPGVRSGPLHELYTEYTFGTIGAWAWGFSRCIDALGILGIADMTCIAFSGHSRGGKAALLAGALDNRAAIVNPNASGQGGSGCFRIHMRAIDEKGSELRSEQMSDCAFYGIYHWFGPEMKQYTGSEGNLPFDEHYLKALVAPRILVETESASDIWANIIGTWETAMAAREVYRFLEAEDNLLQYFRKGEHEHTVEDVEKLVSVIRNRMCGEPVAKGAFVLPFKKQRLIYHWKCPRNI